MNKYDAIVFDFGNIFLDLDFEATFNKFQELLGIPFLRDNIPEELKHPLRQHERGKLSTDDLIASFQKVNGDITKESFIDAWNLMLLGIPKNRIEYIMHLQKDYKIYLLSNINEIHEAWIDDYLLETYGIRDFKREFFDGFYYSHYVGMRKPDKEIYKFVGTDLKEKGVENFIFIDDLSENIEAAKACGWNGAVHNPQYDIVDRLEGYLTV